MQVHLARLGHGTCVSHMHAYGLELSSCRDGQAGLPYKGQRIATILPLYILTLSALNVREKVEIAQPTRTLYARTSGTLASSSLGLI